MLFSSWFSFEVSEKRSRTVERAGVARGFPLKSVKKEVKQ